ncbi:Os11g0206150, partial [Oryza sativa Japonica Group]
MLAKIPTMYLNWPEVRGTPSSSARRTNPSTCFGLDVNIRGANLAILAISQTVSPHSWSSAMLGLITFSRSESTSTLFPFKILRSVSKDPKKGIQNSSLEATSHAWMPLAPPARRKLPIWGSDKPTRSRREAMRRAMLSALAQSSCGSEATTAARSARERPTPERTASTASGLAGDLRWESFLDALSAWAPVRPQVSTRYSSTEKGVAAADLAAVERRRRRRRLRSREEVGRWVAARARSSGRRWSMAPA